MVEAVGDVLEIMDDLTHERIVGIAPAPESLELSVEEPQQAQEMDMLGMPRRDGM
ncbi:hypothetical protein D3C83_91310 [compost metagenome]